MSCGLPDQQTAGIAMKISAALALTMAMILALQVTGLDFAKEMLEDARSRQALIYDGRPDQAEMTWVQGDALDMEFQDDEFDAITMGYGLRNVASIPKALSELHRVLKPGKRVAILDFNNASRNQVVNAFQVCNPIPVHACLLGPCPSICSFVDSVLAGMVPGESGGAHCAVNGLC